MTAPTVSYPICDAAGVLVAIHERIDGPDGKRFLWRQPDGTPGLNGAPLASLPLYGVHLLDGRPTVVITEGEKATDSLIMAGVPAVGTVTGAAATPGRAALADLTGRSVVLWADADDVGRGHMQRIAAGLAGIAADVRRITWPDAPEHGDAADYLARGLDPWDAIDAAETVSAAEPSAPVAAFQCVADATEPADVDDWLIDGLLRPHALGILASAEGIGKSYARLELALRLATGTGSLFGHYPIIRPARVVLVDEENGPSEEYRREAEVLAALGLDRSALTGYFRTSYAGMNLTKPDRQEWLRAELDKIAPDLVIFDTGGAMVADEWGDSLKGAVRYLRSLPCAVLACVHLTKPPRERHSGQHGSALADVMGQWTRSADVVAVMADLGAGRARWTVRKRVPPSSLVLAQRGGVWDVVAVAEDHEAASLETRVLRAIAAGAVTADELRIALGTADRKLPERSLYNALRNLRADGLVAEGTPLTLTDAGTESAE